MTDFTLRMKEIFKSLGYEEKKEKKPIYQELENLIENVKKNGKFNVSSRKYCIGCIFEENSKKFNYKVYSKKNPSNQKSDGKKLQFRNRDGTLKKSTFLYSNIPQNQKKSTNTVKKSFNLQLKDVTPENAIEKFNKAYGVIAYQLGIHKSQTGKSLNDKGEGFYYDSQKELTEQYFKYFDTLTKELYEAVCNYCGLPLSNVVTKAVTYKGKILYNPESGKPLSQADIDKLVKIITKFLNRNRKIGEQIVTEAQVLGKLLKKLANNNTLENVKKLKLEAMKYKNTSFTTLTATESKLMSVFNVDRETANRIELFKQSAAQHITNINDKIKNDVQTVLIDGIKNKKSKSQISQDLFNKLGAENRDWKKIADTEIQNNLNHAYINETVKEANGEKVYFQRMEVIDGRTCAYCKKMNGTVALYSNVPLENDKIDDKYATHAIWEGKDWAGENGILTSGIFHPSCRGVWVQWDPITF